MHNLTNPANRFAQILPGIAIGLATFTLAVVAPDAQALGAKTDFSVTIGPAVLCRDKLEMKYLYDYLSASFGPAYRQEQGAYWFRTKTQLFGKDLVEVFVSDQSSEWEFVGAVFKIKPEEVAKAVQTAAGPIFVKTASGYQYSPYQAQATSEIMWQGKNAKLVCRHHVGSLISPTR
ncbi:MAG TPA: hypothetical protein VIF60_04950 [Burkholderiaceae bacterium]|jgi:hypothetical protein